MKRTKIKTYTLPYRRKRQGLTNYKKRLNLIKSKKNRLVIRKSLNNTTAQLVEYKPNGDKIIVSAHTNELKKMDWKFHCGNIPSAYLTGLLIGKRALKKKINSAVLDMGLQKNVKSSRIYAVLKGVVDAGLTIPHSTDILPPDDRISGKHIADYGSQLSQNQEIHQQKFSKYLSRGLRPEQLSEHFSLTRKKIASIFEKEKLGP